MTENVGPGWLVGGQPYWQEGHEATWLTPDIGDLVDAYEEAYAGGAAARADAARAFGHRFNADAVFEKYWEPIMTDLSLKLTDKGGLAQEVEPSSIPDSLHAKYEGWRKVK
jgi:hypothetical protein